jgi:hypothetical protein
MGQMRGKGAIAGYVPGPFGTDSGRFWTVLDVIGRYLGHRFSGFKGFFWLGRKGVAWAGKGRRGPKRRKGRRRNKKLRDSSREGHGRAPGEGIGHVGRGGREERGREGTSLPRNWGRGGSWGRGLAVWRSWVKVLVGGGSVRDDKPLPTLHRKVRGGAVFSGGKRCKSLGDKGRRFFWGCQEGSAR